jgi:hypothetical protein
MFRFMSLHYEWTVSLRFRRDVPEAFLEDLRSDFGIGPGFAPDGDGSELPGGPVTRLVRQQLSADTWLWGLYLRVMVLDDAMYELIQTEPPRLARWSATQGWIGFAREEMSLHPWLNFYVQDGHAYAAGPGEGPKPLSEGAPPFTLRQTTESWGRR